MAIRKPRPEGRTESSPASRPAPPNGRTPSRGPKFRASVRRDGAVTIPASVRRLMALEPGGEVQLEVTFDGLVVRPVHEGRDPEQWWYWTEAWQKGEREADEETGRGEVFLSSEAFLSALEALSHPK